MASGRAQTHSLDDDEGKVCSTSTCERKPHSLMDSHTRPPRPPRMPASVHQPSVLSDGSCDGTAGDFRRLTQSFPTYFSLWPVPALTHPQHFPPSLPAPVASVA